MTLSWIPTVLSPNPGTTPPKDAEAWAADQKDEFGFIAEVYGANVMTTFEDDIAREDLTACAEGAAQSGPSVNAQLP